MQYITIDNTLGESYINKPWEILKDAVNKGVLVKQRFYMGSIRAGSQFEFFGTVAVDGYCTFIVQSYSDEGVWHIFSANYGWFYGQATSGITSPF